jgi:hypothetical protein
MRQLFVDGRSLLEVTYIDRQNRDSPSIVGLLGLDHCVGHLEQISRLSEGWSGQVGGQIARKGSSQYEEVVRF